jgi:hypothetical protein
MTRNADFEDWHFEPVATEEEVRVAEDALGRRLPGEYIAFLCEHGSGEGFVGKNYLMLWRASELEQFNRGYRVEEFAPGLLLFGSSGGGEAYAFDLRDEHLPIVRVPFIPMQLKYVRPVAPTFVVFLERLATEED